MINIDYLIDDVEDINTVYCILESYCIRTTKLLTELELAIKNNNYKEIHRIAHRIRGGALTLSAAGLEKSAQVLEKAAKKHSINKGLDLLKDIQIEYNSVVNHIRSMTEGTQNE